MNAKPLIYSALVVALAHATGCQSWQGASFPMQNATRVPPPGTGTYQLPSGYYNNTNTSSLAPVSQTMQANNASTGSFQSANNPSSGVVPAGFQSSPASPTPVARAQFNNSGNSSSSGAAANLRDEPSAESPSLQWQQFDGR